MKKRSVCLMILVLGLAILISGCAPAKWLWCSSNGIMSYNPRTGQFEMLWEYAAQPQIVIHDTVYVDKSVSLPDHSDGQ